MPTAVGIDIRPAQVRAARVSSSYRKVRIEKLLEVETAYAGSVTAAIAAVLGAVAQAGDPLVVAIEGERSFVHRIRLPATAGKQLADVLAYEIEAAIPIEISELTYDYKRLPNEPDGSIVLLAAAARTEHIRSRLMEVKAAVGREPERVACGPLALANLAALVPDLEAESPTALVDLGGSKTEVVVLVGGLPVYARTLTRGVDGLPETAPQLSAELRQTFAAWSAAGAAPIERAILVGAGASAPGAEAYLSAQLGVPMTLLDSLTLDGLDADQVLVLPRFAKALGLGLSIASRARDPDLRRGDLAVKQGYGLLKEKAPVLAGLGLSIALSFGFASWAELRGLDADHERLAKALGQLSKSALGEETQDPDRVAELVDKSRGGDDADPMPHWDAFDVLASMSRGVPQNVSHDLEDFDMQRGHVRLSGVVTSTADAQTVASTLKSEKCVQEPKIGKITQVVNSDKQKYSIEFDVRCPDDASAKKKKPKDEAAAPGGEP